MTCRASGIYDPCDCRIMDGENPEQYINTATCVYVLSALVLPFPLESRLRPPIKGLVWSFASTLEAEPHFDDASVSCRNVNINPNVKTRRVIATPPRVGKLFWCCVGAM